jgi:hypothetical protein
LAHPLCRWPNPSALRDFARWTLLETVKSPAIPLFEFRLRVGLCPVLPSRIWTSQSPGSSHGLWLPFSTYGNEGLLAADFALPATFRPQGLVTLSAACSLRSLASFFSRRQRSWEVPLRSFLLPGGARAFPRERTHIPFCPAVSPPPKASARPDGSRFLSFDPPESSWRYACV